MIALDIARNAPEAPNAALAELLKPLGASPIDPSLRRRTARRSRAAAVRASLARVLARRAEAR